MHSFKVHITFSRKDNIPVYKISLNEFKKMEIILSMFSDYNAMRQESNYKGKKLQKTEIC